MTKGILTKEEIEAVVDLNITLGRTHTITEEACLDLSYLGPDYAYGDDIDVSEYDVVDSSDPRDISYFVTYMTPDGQNHEIDDIKTTEEFQKVVRQAIASFPKVK